MLKGFVFLAAILWAGCVAAADKLAYGPPPAWVKPIAIPETPAPADGAAVQVLLMNQQSRYGPDGDESYSELAIRVVAPEGLAAMGNLARSWDPQTETLTIHKLEIVRDGKRIPVLANGKTFTVLRRETNLELAMLDGDLTASIQLEGLRVGDIVDSAVTIRRRDLVLQGHSEDVTGLAGPGVLSRVYLRALWPTSKPLRWRTTKGLAAPTVSSIGQESEAVIDLTSVRAPKPPNDAPERFRHPGLWEMSDFTDWAQVSSLMAPLYVRASTLTAKSPLKIEAERIAAASNDPKTRAAQALALTQEQVRYAFLGMNLGGYIPADADVTWNRRFGDCKGKTVLLLALLHELGIEAQPALVSTTFGDGLDERLPKLDLFDHVIVRAVIGGKVYWLDGTRRGDRSLDAIPAPAFRWALPVRPQGAALETISQSPFDQPQTEIVARLDASGGLDTPASAHVEAIFRGDAGIGMRLALASAGREDAERYVKEFWTRSFPWINAARVDFSPDEANGVTRLSLDGAANMDWSSDGSAREFNIAESGLGADTAFRREPGPDDDAPFAVSYPAFAKSTVTVILPRQGENFQLAGGGDVDKTVAGVAYHRRSRLEKGVVTMEASTRSLKPEFAFADGPIAQAGLRQLAEADVLIRTVDTPAAGGPARVTATVMPRDAAGFGARGSAYLMQRDYGHAIADFTTAMRLAPGAAKYAYNRGVAHFEKGESVLALADFDHAVALNPKDELAASARGQIFLARGDQLAAQKAFAQAIALAPDHPDALWRAANAFDEAGKFQIAIQYYDDLIRRFPADTHLAQMLNARCWTRGESGQELDIALGDCEAALKLAPGSANILDSRAFVELRLSQLDKAITDYDDALAREPSEADSLYGRGLAKARKGLKADSARDLTEATRLEPTIAAKYSAYGLRP